MTPPYTPGSELSDELFAEPFCSYCGRPPHGARGEPAPRVCSHCKLGMMLRTFPDAAPGLRDPFLIVDEHLTVQAISRQAEAVLMVDEPAGVGVALDQFLVADERDPSSPHLARLVELVRGGSRPAKALALRTVGEPQIRFTARISGCGAPLAALLVLTPLHASDMLSRTGATPPEPTEN